MWSWNGSYLRVRFLSISQVSWWHGALAPNLSIFWAVFITNFLTAEDSSVLSFFPTILSSSKKNKSVQLFKVHFFSSLWMMLEKGKLDSEIPGRVNQLKLRKNSLPFCLLSFFSLFLVNKKFRWETLSRKRRSFQGGDEKKKLDWDFYWVGCFVSRVTKCCCWRGSQGDGGPFKKKIII